MTKCIITVLGCGGSGGVPLATGHWGDCDPKNPKNRRTRSCLWVKTEETSLVIDTGPDFHEQTMRAGIDHIDAVLYTHDHADHVNGIDDVRYLAIKQRVNGDQDYMFPIHLNQKTFDSLKYRFEYLFKTSDDGLYRPLFDTNIVESGQDITIGNINMTLFNQIHGANSSLGIRIGDFTYSTDVSDFDDSVLQSLKGTKTWIVDCGQFGFDETTVHANYDKVLRWNDIVQAEKLYLTHLTPRIDYDVMQSKTPDHIEPSYDGLTMMIEL
jgi:phosphoribosyl 1,2-cyclic phosphate phosphodiesterase